MRPLPHHYEVTLTRGPSGCTDLSAPGVPSLRTAPPADYDGPGDAWSPEHLLLASVQACFLFALRAIARQSRVLQILEKSEKNCLDERMCWGAGRAGGCPGASPSVLCESGVRHGCHTSPVRR